MRPQQQFTDTQNHNTQQIAPEQVYTQYLRCYTEITPKKEAGNNPKKTRAPKPLKQCTELETAIDAIGAPYHGWVFVFDTETSTSIDQSLKVGCYSVYGVDQNTKVLLATADSLTREILDSPMNPGCSTIPRN